jgi:transposase
MSIGKRPEKREQDLWVPTQDLARAPGHPFYRALNKLLREEQFDRHVEELCAPHYGEGGRPSIPPGTYFRMLFVGYFEGLDSQRGIAWRCADSLSLREFLGLDLRDRSPEHSSLTRIRQRLPLELHQEVFSFVVGIAMRRGLLKGKRAGIDSTILEANAAMKSITRKDSGEAWKEYVRRLAAEEKDGDEPPDDQETRRFDRKRKGKRVSNKDWESKTDPDAGIARMKDGRTRLSYKAEHAVDLDSDIVLAAYVTSGHHADPATVMDTLTEAQAVLVANDESAVIEDLVLDKGYHKA